MKKAVGLLTLLSLMFSPGMFAENGDSCPAAEVETPVYIEDEAEPFNRGAFVSVETDLYATQRWRQRAKNWGIALGAVTIGVAALLFAKKN